MPTTETTPTLAEQVAAADAGTLTSIAIDRIHVAPWNARKTLSAAGMDELIASIREHGIQVPLLVRVRTGASVASGFTYEIVAGHRRYRAAFKLNLPRVPCIVRDLDDEEAQEIGLVDNLQREDVPALEEADAYAELRERLGTPAAIAQRVGKEVGYVAKRLQLVSLGEFPRKALAERLITVDHALLLARLGAIEQDVNLKWLLNPNAGVKVKVEDVITSRLKDRAESRSWGWHEPQSPLQLKMHIEEHVGRKLSRAPWDLDATNLTEDGVACAGCPSNTRDNTALFGDLDIEEATCENGRCFEEKRATFVHIRLEAAAAAGRGGFKLSWKDSVAAPRFEKETTKVNPSQTFRRGQWVEAKKGSCENAAVGVTVDWSDSGNRGFMGSNAKLRKPGEILTVCVAAKCKAHPKAWEKAAKTNQTATQASPEERAAQQRAHEQKVLAENKLRFAAAQKAVDAVTKLPEAALRSLLLDLNRSSEMEALLPGLRKALESDPLDSVRFAQAVAILSIDSMRVYPYQQPDQWRKDFLSSIKRLGLDASSLWQKPKAEKKAAAKPASKPAKKALPKKDRKAIGDRPRKRIAAVQKRQLAKKKGAPK